MTPTSFACTDAGSGGGEADDADGEGDGVCVPLGRGAVRVAALPPQAATTAPTAAPMEAFRRVRRVSTSATVR